MNIIEVQESIRSYEIQEKTLQLKPVGVGKEKSKTLERLANFEHSVELNG